MKHEYIEGSEALEKFKRGMEALFKVPKSAAQIKKQVRKPATLRSLVTMFFDALPPMLSRVYAIPLPFLSLRSERRFWDRFPVLFDGRSAGTAAARSSTIIRFWNSESITAGPCGISHLPS